jgi:dynein heavy chain
LYYFLLSLQSLLKGAGKDGHTTVFLLTDTQIKQESFLEDVDGLLNAGEVANLYAIDEKQEIIEVLNLLFLSACPYSYC